MSEDPAGRGLAGVGGSARPATAQPPAAPPPTARRPASRRSVVTLAVTAAVLLTLDVVTKLVAVASLSDRGPVELIPGVLDLQLTRNSGAAFSLAGGATVLLSLVALAVIGVVVITARRLRSPAWAAVLGALLGGALGNLLDRVFRAPGPLRGHVVDFVHLHHWPIFNVADSAIVCGGILAVVLSLRGIGLDGSRLGESAPAEPAAPDRPTAADAPTTAEPTTAEPHARRGEGSGGSTPRTGP